MDKPNGISKITIVRAGPEKAGVGGSTPSLATIFSIRLDSYLWSTTAAFLRLRKTAPLPLRQTGDPKYNDSKISCAEDRVAESKT